jgi:hypothetical protein
MSSSSSSSSSLPATVVFVDADDDAVAAAVAAVDDAERAAKRARIADEFKCAICCDMFVTPGTLPCGCTYCVDCLKAYATGALAVAATQLPCPTCRTEHARAVYTSVGRNIVVVNSMRRELGAEYELRVAEVAAAQAERERADEQRRRVTLERALRYVNAHLNGAAELGDIAYYIEHTLHARSPETRADLLRLIDEGRLATSRQWFGSTDARETLSSDFVFAPENTKRAISLALDALPKQASAFKMPHKGLLVNLLVFTSRRQRLDSQYALLYTRIADTLQTKVFAKVDLFLGLRTERRRHCDHCSGAEGVCQCKRGCARPLTLCKPAPAPAPAAAAAPAPVAAAPPAN